VRAGRLTSEWLVLALAIAFAGSGAAQTPAIPDQVQASAADTIAANDPLAATAGIGTTDSPPSTPAPAAASAANVPPTSPAAPSTFDRWENALGVKAEDVRWLRLGVWDGSVGFSYAGTRQDLGYSGSEATSSTTRLATEYVTLRNDGWSIFDPRLVSGSLGVTLGFDQLSQDFAGQEQPQHGKITGYSFDATFFGEKALNARIWADRVEGFSTLPFVGNLKSTDTSTGVMVNLLQHSWLRDLDILPWFDAKLQVYEQRTLQQYDTGTTSTSYDQIQDVIQLDAHNGGENSDLYVTAKFIDFQFPTFPTGSYRSQGGAVTYSGDFGANLDTTWSSSVTYDDRSGDIPLQTFTVGESLDVHHNTDLESLYAYNLYQQNSPGDDTTSQNASASIVYNLWRHLSLTAQAQSTYSQYPSGTLMWTNGTVGIDYSRPLPGGGQVFASAQGSYARASDNLSSGDVSIVEEAHAAPPILGVGTGFVLNNPNVDASSIVVVDMRGGARYPTTVNVDYTVTADGNQTRILVLPTSHVIQAGDPLAVSYGYLVPAQASYNSSTESFSAGFDLGWLGASYTHTQNTAPELTQGTVTLVGNSTSDTLTGSLRAHWDPFNASLVGNAVRFQSVGLAYVTQSYNAGLDYRPFYEIGLTFTGAWSQGNYTAPTQRTSGASNARVDLNFYAPSSPYNDVLTASLFGLRNRLTDSELPAQTYTQVGATLNYTLGKLTFIATAQYGQFANGSSTTKSEQFNVSINRRF